MKVGLQLSEEERMLQLINHERLSRGLKPLSMNPILQHVARMHSQEMIDHDYFSHISEVDGSNPYERVVRSGYYHNYTGVRVVLENIIMDSRGPLIEEMHRRFMESPPHADNILSSHVNEVGIGLAFGEYHGFHVAILTQVFAYHSRDNYPVVEGVWLNISVSRMDWAEKRVEISITLNREARAVVSYLFNYTYREVYDSETEIYGVKNISFNFQTGNYRIIAYAVSKDGSTSHVTLGLNTTMTEPAEVATIRDFLRHPWLLTIYSPSKGDEQALNLTLSRVKGIEKIWGPAGEGPVIFLGGPLVNVYSKLYNQRVGVHFNVTYKPTIIMLETKIGAWTVNSTHYGRMDYAVAYLYNDEENSRICLVVEGCTRYGTLACISYILDEKPRVCLIVVKWEDINRNRKVDPFEVEEILASEKSTLFSLAHFTDQ